VYVCVFMCVCVSVGVSASVLQCLHVRSVNTATLHRQLFADRLCLYV